MSDSKPGRLPQQPSAAAQHAVSAAKETAKTYYQVAHGAVGQWAQGTVISSDDLAGIDVDRLLKLGAIVETAAPSEEPPPAAADGE